MAPLLEINATLFCFIGTRQTANPFSVFDIDVCKKGGDYFPVSICPSKRIKSLHACCKDRRVIPSVYQRAG
jgi:hypothetical protein